MYLKKEVLTRIATQSGQEWVKKVDVESAILNLQRQIDYQNDALSLLLDDITADRLKKASQKVRSRIVHER